MKSLLAVPAAVLALGWMLVPGVEAFAQGLKMAPNLSAPNPFNVQTAGYNPVLNGDSFFNRGANPYGSFSATSVGTGGQTMTSLPPPPPYYPYYPYNYVPSVYGDYLRGLSSLVDSGGRLMVTTQEAYLMQEQVKREKIANRRRVLEQWLWERNNLPTPQDEFERLQKLELRRAQNDPPVNEIFSAKALNDLLIDVQKLQGQGIEGPTIILSEDILRHINVVPPGNGSANAGLLRNDGKLDWPVTLAGREYAVERERINILLPDAINQVKNGKVDPDTLKELTHSVDKLITSLAQNIGQIPPSRYIESKRFLNNLHDALRALSSPNAKHFFSGKYSAKGRSVAELVRNMTEQGLRFAPAVPGDEAAYIALHRALASFDISANEQASAR
ncbi:MAG: hypothetical protein KatS3mg105_0062 [Gemmatales bacterium]|nr:MAG: hypothetical protein KatS3mg105_0062 [Gemmatales bacterium]